MKLTTLPTKAEQPTDNPVLRLPTRFSLARLTRFPRSTESPSGTVPSLHLQQSQLQIHYLLSKLGLSETELDLSLSINVVWTDL
jgi:hypothetical protein